LAQAILAQEGSHSKPGLSHHTRKMKFAAALLLLATGVKGLDLSPVTRVVQLLKGLQEETEVQHKKEEDLYETYVCWAKSVISSKTASNEKAKSRIDSLETYVADLKAGRIELTSERADLEKEVAGLHDDMETAEGLRKKEKEDYEAAKSEMDAAIDALKAAIKVLEEATKDASLVSMRSRLNAESQSMDKRMAQGQALERAVELGQEFLSRGDAVFLRRFIDGDVPTKDWKKLNRKADFKAKYKKRSGDIQKTLKGLLETFSGNLKEADAKEKKAKEEHKKLMDGKKELLSKAQESLEKMEVEGGARGLTVEEAESEIKDLKTQIKNDEGFIEEVQGEWDKKKKEWKERQEVRSKEQEAISKAIAILHSDDARDLFKKSFASQGFMLLQESEKSSLSWRQEQAKATILKAARKSKDSRLVALASAAGKAGSGFDKVIKAIDDMLSKLKKEEEEDLKIKEECETTREKDTNSAIGLSRDMDDLTDKVAKLESEIEEIEKEIDEKTEEVKEIKKELKEATKIREEENKEFEQNKKDDEAAVVLVSKAAKVLTDFYKENAFVQQQPQFVSKAGEAPPPPPKTWDEPYKGKQEDGTGIVGILEIIEKDIEADISKAEADEKEAQDKYDKMKEESEKSIKDLEEAVDKLEEDKAGKEDDIADAKKEKKTKQGELKSLLEKIKDAEPGCDFFAVNFKTRDANRKLEMEGLTKAKTILKEAKFPEDAKLLQKEAKKHA